MHACTSKSVCCRDGKLSLKELMRVLYKTDPNISLAARARTQPVDAFVLLHVDARQVRRAIALPKIIDCACIS